MPTYLSNHAISQEFNRIRRNDPESTIYGVWNAILNFQFPITQGYVTRPQDQHTLQSGGKGFSDLHTFHYQGNAPRATKFLIVQCKRAGHETRQSVWEEGTAQISDYLSATHKTRPKLQRTSVYGIIAIGKYMRAYIYNDHLNEVADWYPDGMELGVPRHLIQDQTDVQRILDEILKNH